MPDWKRLLIYFIVIFRETAGFACINYSAWEQIKPIGF